MVIRRAKRTQHCTFCKNHGLVEPKKGHQCSYANCPCLLCKLTKKAQVAMRHQQRVWRHQKQKLKTQAEEENSAAVGEKKSKGQACDKCRNHNKIEPKRNHECPYNSCDCEYCSLTFKRREIMKHQQRVRRSRIMSQRENESRSSAEKSADEEVDEEAEEKNVHDDLLDAAEARNASPLNPAVASPNVDVASQDYAPHAPNAPNKMEEKEIEPLHNLSLQFSSLESEYPVSPQELPKPETNNSPVGVIERIPSPPPLLPIETDDPYCPEVDLPMSLQYPYGYATEECTPVQPQKEMYHDRVRFSQEDPVMESSQISTVMLFQNGYTSTSHPNHFPTPRVQQISSSLKISVDQSVNPVASRQYDEFPYRNSERYEHAGLSSAFSNISHTSAIFPHQRQYPFQRRPRDHSVRLLPYFAYPSSNHQ